MFYVNDKGNLTVGEHPGEGWIKVDAPKTSNYRLKTNWKECIPDVWEFNPFKLALRLSNMVDEVIDTELVKSYKAYVKELYKYKLKSMELIDGITSEEEAEEVTNKIESMIDSIYSTDFNSFK